MLGVQVGWRIKPRASVFNFATINGDTGNGIKPIMRAYNRISVRRGEFSSFFFRANGEKMRRINPTIVKLSLLLILLSGSLSNAEENQEVITKFPSCYGADIASWDTCFGVANLFGGKYTGEFKGGRRHGNGVYVNVNGEEYVGAFKDGEKHGNGALIYLNGDKYEGGTV